MARTTLDNGIRTEHPLDKQPEIMTTPKGTDFTILKENNGLYYIHMIKAGGKVPNICEEKYTALSLAKMALEGYIASKE